LSLSLRVVHRLIVFVHRVLRRIFWREGRGNRVVEKTTYEELNDLYSPNIVRVIKSRRMTWTRHVARMVERRGVYRVVVGKP